MPKDIQSIEDLISPSDDLSRDESAQNKFSSKEKAIRLKNIERITKEQAAGVGLSYINLSGFPISQEALSLVEEERAKELSTVCFFYNGQDLRLATTNPGSEELKVLFQELLDKCHCSGEIYLISKTSLEYALNLYKALPRIKKIKGDIEITQEDLDKYGGSISSFKDLQKYVGGTDITQIVTVIMAAAIKSGASDIHIEIEENDIKIRFRVDGMLYDVAILDKELWRKIISRFKMMSKAKINITDKPQEGRISIYLKDGKVDIRVSFLPTAYGESVVMRLLKSDSIKLDFKDLGLRGKSYERLKREVNRPNGMIITAGPTGSGKTTTLYAILKKLNKSETKIITIEDPIEYQLEGISQSQTSEKYTFAQGLRSIVRQDPDIIMVGENRDLETAQISIQAALTGHLVLSTIHTNDAAGTVPRFLSMGVKPFLLAPALNAVIGQRLVRKICKECKQENRLDDETMNRVKEILNKFPEEEKENINIDDLKFFKSTGCEVCQGIGYKGRIGIYEVLVMDGDMGKLILSDKVSEYDIRDYAIKHGMITMAQDGLLKALDGITSVEEVFRVVD